MPGKCPYFYAGGDVKHLHLAVIIRIISAPVSDKRLCAVIRKSRAEKQFSVCLKGL